MRYYTLRHKKYAIIAQSTGERGEVMITVEQIKKKVADSKEEALQCLVEAIQSPSPTGSELPMALTMKKWLDKLGIQVDTYEYQKDRPNFIAEWKGTQEGKTFLFNGHMDVFPPQKRRTPATMPGPARSKTDLFMAAAPAT